MKLINNSDLNNISVKMCIIVKGKYVRVYLKKRLICFDRV